MIRTIKRVCLLVVVCLTLPASSGLLSAQPTLFRSDLRALEVHVPRPGPRFSGLYCAEPISVCKDIFIVDIFVDTCITIEDVRVTLRQIDTPKGDLISGSGTLTVEGERLALAVAGHVSGPGQSRLSVTVSQVGQVTALPAVLSSDGQRLRISMMNKEINLSKQACRPQ